MYFNWPDKVSGTKNKKKVIIPNNMNWKNEFYGVKEICKPNPEQAGKSKYDTSPEEAEYTWTGIPELNPEKLNGTEEFPLSLMD